MSQKLEKLFAACKCNKKNKASRGGSYASDAVNGSLDVSAFERINFLLSGGNAALPPFALPTASADPSPSISFQSSLSQPLAFSSDIDNVATFPSYLASFSPLLTNY